MIEFHKAASKCFKRLHLWNSHIHILVILFFSVIQGKLSVTSVEYSLKINELKLSLLIFNFTHILRLWTKG